MNHSPNLFLRRLKAAIAGACLCVLIHGAHEGSVYAAEKSPTLNEAGNRLKLKYAESLQSVRAEIGRQLPKIDERNRDAFVKAWTAEGAAKQALDRAVSASNKANQSKDAAQQQLATTAVKETQAAYKQAQEDSLAAAQPILLSLSEFLSGDLLDKQLVRCAILADATPQGLAAFAQGGNQQAALIEQLLANDELMKQMLLAGGAKAGQYGRAMEIYAGIQRASTRADKGVLQRLALGTSLELAGVNGPGDGGTAVIDPVPRYLNFEKAYLAGELDPAFETMSAWECRFITNEPSTDQELNWARQMLRNYRPDVIFEPDYRWRYVRLVRSDVHYQHFDFDPEAPTTKIQQFLDGGGQCGPRAFVGRLLLRSFGIPTWGVRQTGHAALSHWTPGGWTVNFGAAWEYNWWEDRPGPDFLLETQAREHHDEFLKVLRAQWVADALAEAKVDAMRPGTGGLWNALALMQKRAIVKTAKPTRVALAGEELAESNISNEAQTIQNTPATPADKTISVSADGVITIPAVACTSPQRSTSAANFMKSFAGGMQLYLQSKKPVEYTVTLPADGKYTLTARVVTLHKNLHLQISTAADAVPISIDAPYTVGKWQDTRPIQIKLSKGKNVLRVAQDVATYGLAIKEFKLTPTK